MNCKILFEIIIIRLFILDQLTVEMKIKILFEIILFHLFSSFYKINKRKLMIEWKSKLIFKFVENTLIAKLNANFWKCPNEFTFDFLTRNWIFLFLSCLILCFQESRNFVDELVWTFLEYPFLFSINNFLVYSVVIDLLILN